MQSRARTLVAALAYVHDHDLLHCDIAPDNIFLEASAELMLIDFGAARLLAGGQAQKNAGMTVVKDCHSPHEPCFSGENIGPWTDLCSLAASLYHAISGTVPDNSQNRLAAMVEHHPDPLVPLARRFPNYPQAFLGGIGKAMTVMPAARPQSAAEWLKALPASEENTGAKVKLFRKSTPQPAPQSVVAAPVPEPVPAVAEILTRPVPPKGRADFNLESARAANTEAVKAKLRAIQLLDLKDSIKDIPITLGKQLHLIRPLDEMPTVLLHVALDKTAANLGVARVQVRNVEQSVTI